MWEYLSRDLPKHSIRVLLADINKIHRMDAADFNNHFYHRPGIRAQLVDKKKKFLINDFVLRAANFNEDSQEAELGRSFEMIHALNISSPGWTSAFPFVNRIAASLLGLDEDELLSTDDI